MERSIVSSRVALLLRSAEIKLLFHRFVHNNEHFFPPSHTNTHNTLTTHTHNNPSHSSNNTLLEYTRGAFWTEWLIARVVFVVYMFWTLRFFFYVFRLGVDWWVRLLDWWLGGKNCIYTYLHVFIYTYLFTRIYVLMFLHVFMYLHGFTFIDWWHWLVTLTGDIDWWCQTDVIYEVWLEAKKSEWFVWQVKIDWLVELQTVGR